MRIKNYKMPIFDNSKVRTIVRKQHKRLTYASISIDMLDVSACLYKIPSIADDNKYMYPIAFESDSIYTGNNP